MTNNTCNNLTTWFSVPIGTTEVNSALLNAAKSLLQNIYTYSQGTPDFCPSSYTNFNSDLTSYLVHSVHDTYVYWPPVQNQQQRILWTSKPGTIPPGWSGTVTEAGYNNLPSDAPANATTNAMCVTDCSGFITSLFTYVNQQVKTDFAGWQAVSENTIPEAGCFDPGPGSEDCQHPNPINYYKFFTNPGYGFQAIALADIQPGDLLAWANGAKEPKDSGHIMLVAAVANDPSDPSGQTKQVVVVDESSGHTLDSRGTASGLGLGIVVLSTNDSTNELKFYWTVDNFNQQPPVPQPGSVALGRALKA